MAKKFLTDDQVEAEIELLTKSEHVKLARREQRLKYKRRQQLYMLRYLESRGKQLEEDGWTLDNLEELISKIDLESEKGCG